MRTSTNALNKGRCFQTAVRAVEKENKAMFDVITKYDWYARYERFMAEEDYQTALHCLIKARDLAIAREDAADRSEAHVKLARFFRQVGRWDRACANYDEAVNWLAVKLGAEHAKVSELCREYGILLTIQHYLVEQAKREQQLQRN